MSYGWLTESSLLPKKQVKIDIESKTFVDLKVNLLKEKEKLKRKEEIRNNANYQRKCIIKSKLNLKNQQDSRNEENEEGHYKNEKIIMELKEPEFSDFERIKDHLTKKELLYEKLKDSNARDWEKEESLQVFKDSCLVDFDLKRIEDKKKKKLNKRDLNQNISKEELNKISQINSEISDNSNNISRQNVLVKQSYDRTLSENEKLALESIIEEETDYKKKIEYLKKKKNLEREERLERIKKMKIEDVLK